MMDRDIKWMGVASTYIGTVIGAGFASGQEILQFFGNYGTTGILGVIVSTLLFSGIGAIVLCRVYNGKYQSYQELIFPVLGRKLGFIIDFFMLLYLFMSFCIMLAGSGALFEQRLNISYDIGLAIMAVISVITIMYSVKGISMINTVLIPILLAGMIIIGMTVTLKEGINISYDIPIQPIKYSWILSSILYVSYNTLSVVVVLCSLLPIINSRKTAIKGGIMGGVGLGIMSIFILLPILIIYKDIRTLNLEIPMLKVSEYIGSSGGLVYSLILWAAMLTTAVGNGFGLVSRVSDITKINFRILIIILCIITVPFAKMGFSNLVSTVYPLFGYVGAFFLLIFILRSIYKKIVIS